MNVLFNAPVFPRDHFFLDGSQVSPNSPSSGRNKELQMSKEHWWNDTNRGNPKYLDKNLSHFHSEHHNFTRTDLELNPGLGGERPATNRLSNATAERRRINLNYV